jgi:Ca2+-binding EF-hand superfamily protein
LADKARIKALVGYSGIWEDDRSMRTALVIILSTAGAFAQERQQPPMDFIKASPILNIIDTNQDGVISAAEIAASPAQLRKLDKNGDGKLNREEAGMQMPGRGGGRGGRGEGRGEGRGGGGPEETPAPPPSVEDLTAMFMAFDANHNGQLEKSEVPERLQGMFERGDANKDGILTRDEIAKLAQANQKMNLGPEGGRGRGGPPFDMAFNALDTNKDGEISADEINNAPAALRTLDKNGDGQITNDEVTPAFGRGPGGPDGRGRAQ